MRYFISTGELSGDLHASYLVEEIMKLDKESQIFAIGGKNLKKLKVNIFKDIDQLAIMGFVEVIKNINMLKKILDETYNFIIDNKIDRVILVDYGGFNLKLLERLKKNHKDIKIFYYIPPKVWIWGRKRIDKIRLADEILVIFPWEVDFYKEYNINVRYFGNPFMEKYSKKRKKGEKILLLPGSRKQEIESLTPYMLEVVDQLKKEEFILKLPSREHGKYISSNLEEYNNLTVEYHKNLKEVAEESKYAIAASGTVILELAILGLPGIVVYKTSIINELIVRLIIKLKYVSLPNLTLDREVYKELLQKECNKNKILEEISILEAEGSKVEALIEEVREKLDGENIIGNYSKIIVEGSGDHETKTSK